MTDIETEPARISVTDFEAIAWLEPWELASEDQRGGLDAELRRELSPGHALAGSVCVSVAVRGDRDDALFIVDGARLAVVHLTWSQEKDPRWPSVAWLEDVPAFVNERMRADHAAFVA